MILGIGIDIVEVARVRKAFERTGEGFLSRIYTPDEKEYCRGFVDPWPHFAAMFAAKESVIKAISQVVDPREVGVSHQPSGAPVVVLRGSAAETMARYGTVEILLSLSHTRGVAIAFALASC